MLPSEQAIALCEADVRAFPGKVERLRPAVRFEAWRMCDDGQDRRQRFGVTPPVASLGMNAGQAWPLENMPECATLREVVDWAATCCQHKDHFVVVERHDGKRSAVAHVYAVKQESKPSYRTTTGLRTSGSEAYHKRYWQHLFDMRVDAFAPTLPFRVTRDTTVAEIVGIDPQLVEGDR